MRVEINTAATGSFEMTVGDKTNIYPANFGCYTKNNHSELVIMSLEQCPVVIASLSLSAGDEIAVDGTDYSDYLEAAEKVNEIINMQK